MPNPEFNIPTVPEQVQQPAADIAMHLAAAMLAAQASIHDVARVTSARAEAWAEPLADELDTCAQVWRTRSPASGQAQAPSHAANALLASDLLRERPVDPRITLAATHLLWSS